MATFPEWAAMPAVILITALGLYVMVWLIRWRRSRADGVYLLAQAALPLDQQQAGYSKSYASPDRRFVDPDARMAEVGGPVTPPTVPFARLVAWLNRFYKGAVGRFFASDGPGTLALPGARSSRTFTLGVVLLVVAAVMTFYVNGRRDGS